MQRQLRPDSLRLKICLELNSSHISHAVNAFIDFKVRELAERSDYNRELREEARDRLCENAEGTFLWLALVRKELRQVSALENSVCSSRASTWAGTTLGANDGSNPAEQRCKYESTL